MFSSKSWVWEISLNSISNLYIFIVVVLKMRVNFLVFPASLSIAARFSTNLEIHRGSSYSDDLIWSSAHGWKVSGLYTGEYINLPWYPSSPAKNISLSKTKIIYKIYFLCKMFLNLTLITSSILRIFNISIIVCLFLPYCLVFSFHRI